MTTTGPRIAWKNGTEVWSSVSSSISSKAWSTFFARNPANKILTTNATNAGIIFLAIKAVKSNWNASEAAIVFGFGEIIFPAFPPPIIANKIPAFDKFAFFAIAIAIGATVITAISINTPTAQIIIVAIAIAATALFSPNFFTIVSAIVSAEPVLIKAPAKIPEVIILNTGDIIPCAPVTIALTEPANPAPPITPPTKAPKIKL